MEGAEAPGLSFCEYWIVTFLFDQKEKSHTKCCRAWTLRCFKNLFSPTFLTFMEQPRWCPFLPKQAGKTNQLNINQRVTWLHLLFSHWFPAQTHTRVTDRRILKPWLVDQSLGWAHLTENSKLCMHCVHLRSCSSLYHAETLLSLQQTLSGNFPTASRPQIHREDAINLQLPLLFESAQL